MKFRFHSRSTLPLLISLSFSAPFAVLAQDILPSPKVLVISREYTKLGKEGAPHQAVEGAYPPALAAGKVPNHYYAAVSIFRTSRVLFFHSYASFADMAAAQKAPRATRPSPPHSTALTRRMPICSRPRITACG